MGLRSKAAPRKRSHKPRATWRVVRIETTPGLYRLVGPLSKQRGKQRAICIAIGGKRLRAIVDALNEMGIEV